MLILIILGPQGLKKMMTGRDRARPGRTEPDRAGPSRTEPDRAGRGRTEPDRAGPIEDLRRA